MDWLGLATSGLQRLGYFAIFLLVIAGSLGLPLPEESIFLLSGYLASLGFFEIWLVIAIGILGSLAGDNLGYWLARKKGLAFMMRHGHIFYVSKAHLKKAEAFFKKHGGKAVFFARFIIGFRFFGPVLAGVSNMPWKKFQVYNLLGVVIWIPFISFAGYLFGTNIGAILSNLKEFSHIFFIVMLILLSWLLVRQLVKED